MTILYKRRILLPIYRQIAKLLSGHGLKKYHFVSTVNKQIKSQLSSDFALVDGNKMYLGPRDHLSLSTLGVYEPMETELVKREIKKDDVTIDIGAFIGYYTLIFAKLVGDKGKVFAFEPYPTSFSILEKNVKVNDYRNIILEKKGISNTNHKSSFFPHETDKDDESTETEFVSLDEYFKNYEGRVDFIKMDIEGAEKLAIEGMQSILRKNKNIKILTEFHPIALKEFGTEPIDYLQILRGYGFEIYHVDNKKKTVEPINDKELLEIYPSKESLTNLFCKRK
jgi:FkbM family methyltransferase